MVYSHSWSFFVVLSPERSNLLTQSTLDLWVVVCIASLHSRFHHHTSHDATPLVVIGGCRSPFPHQSQGSTFSTPLSDWPSDGISIWNRINSILLSLFPAQGYWYKGIFRFFDPGKAVEPQVDFILETFHEDTHATRIVNQQTGHKKNSRDSGSSSKDGGKIYDSW